MTETEFHAINAQFAIPASVLCSDEYHQMEMMIEKRRHDEAIAAVRKKRATFEDLVVIEPCLQWLADDARAFKASHGRKRYRCANARWYGFHDWQGLGLRSRLIQIVGWETKRPPSMRSEYVYSLAYDHIYSLLPNCRGCNCA